MFEPEHPQKGYEREAVIAEIVGWPQCGVLADAMTR
jgi:hypothetical protein